MKTSTTKICLKGIRYVIAAAMFGIVFTVSAEAQKLVVGQPVQKSISGGSTHEYQLSVKAGQFARVEVEQQNIEVVAALLEKRGNVSRVITELSGKNNHLWRESISALPTTNTEYRVTIKALGDPKLSGTYTLKIAEMRPSEVGDKKRLEAEQRMSAGIRLKWLDKPDTAGAIRELESALIIWREIDDKLWEAITLSNLGWEFENEEQYSRGIEAHLKALEIYKAIGERAGQGKSYNGLGRIYNTLRNLDKAIEAFTEALTIRREMNDRIGETAVLNNIGDAYFYGKTPGKSIDYYEQALAISSQLKDRDGQMFALSNIGYAYLKLKNYPKMVEYFERALKLSRETGNGRAEGLSLASVGLAYINLKRFEKAEENYALALPLAEKFGLRATAAVILHNLAIIHLDRHDFVKSKAFYEKALEAKLGVGDREGAVNVLLSLALCHMNLFETDLAKKANERALALSREIKFEDGEASALRSLGYILTRAGDYAGSVQQLEKALAIWMRISPKSSEVTQTLTLIGIGYDSAGDHEKAENYLTRAVALAVETQDEERESYALGSLGLLHAQMLDLDNAIKDGERSLALRIKIGGKRPEATALGNLANIYLLANQYEKGAEFFARAREVSRGINDTESEIGALNGIALAMMYQNRYKELAEYAGQAYILSESINYANGKYVALNYMAFVASGTSDYPAAIKYYTESIKLLQETKNELSEGTTIGSLASVYISLGQYEKARELYVQAFEKARKIRNETGEMSATLGLGKVYASLGQFEKARENYEKGLESAKKLKSRLTEYEAVSNLGYVYLNLNQYELSKDYFERALALNTQLKLKTGEAGGLMAAGNLQSDLNQFAKAADSFQQSLGIAKELKDARSEGILLTSLGITYLRTGKSDRALEVLERALAIGKKIGNKDDQARALVNIGIVYKLKKDHKKAITALEQARNLASEVRSRTTEGYAINALGEVVWESGQKEKAKAHFLSALSIAREIGSGRLEAAALSNLMGVYNEQGDHQAAVVYGKLAVNIYQDIRATVKSFNRETRVSYLSDKEDVYRRLAETLIAVGRIPEAEKVLAMLKEEEYSNYLQRSGVSAGSSNAKIELSDDEKEVSSAYEKLAGEITAVGAEYGALEARKRALKLDESLTPEEQARWKELEQKRSVAIGAFNSFLADLKKKFTSKNVNVAMVGSGLQGMLKDLGQPRTAIISTIVGEDALHLIVTTPDIQTAHTMRIERAKLNEMVAEFRKAATSPAIDPRPAGKKLYDVLFPAAVQKDLENIGADTLIFSLDDALRYAPVAALSPDGKTYLAERYTTALISLATHAKLGRQPVERAQWKALALGISKGAEVSGQGGERHTFSPLPAVPSELCGVVKDSQKQAYCRDLLTSNSGVIDGRILSDEEFTADGMKEFVGRVDVVHIASHFNLTYGGGKDSYLLLGGGKTLTLDELSVINFNRVDLLTLSACNTAMTGGTKNGVEVEGFAALAQNNGARSVVATLWAVADPSTRDAMTEFYRRLRADQSLGKAEALRKAQLALMQGSYNPGETPAWRGVELVRTETSGPAFKTDKNAPYAHPYYWSPFILTGDWR